MAKSEGRINKAQENVHKEHRTETRMGGSHGRGSDVGNETKANVKGAQMGGTAAEARGDAVHSNEGMKGHLGHAVAELHKQHPHKHNDHGPHHGTTTHIRHEPVGKVYR